MSKDQAHAFLALWNAITSESVQPEYEKWHSFEHVPERVGLPGFVQATRYRSVTQPLRYFTSYQLGSLDALSTPEYRDVFTNPTPWSVRMRQVLRDFYRLPCQVGGVHGVGSASQLGTLRWRSTRPDLTEKINDLLHALVNNGQAIRAEWGFAPPTEEYWLPNTSSSNLQGVGIEHVLVLQHLDADFLKSSMLSLVQLLGTHASSLGHPEYFEQLTHVCQDEMSNSLGTRRPPHTTLFNQYIGDPGHDFSTKT
jgi:hypothetical protein